MKVRELATALIFWLVSSAAQADVVPVMITGLGLHYSDMDRQITDRVINAAAVNRMYSLIPSQRMPPGHAPFIQVLLTFTDMDEGLIAMTLEILVVDRSLEFSGFVGSGMTFCTVVDQAQCVLNGGLIMQSAINKYVETVLKRIGKPKVRPGPPL